MTLSVKMDEVLQGKDLEAVLVESSKRFKRLKHVADSLGVSYQLLIYWIEKLGVKKEDFYRKKVCRRNCKLVRVNGTFRYKFVRLLKGKCLCYAGFDHIVVSVSEEELTAIALEAGFKIETMVANSDYTVVKDTVSI